MNQVIPRQRTSDAGASVIFPLSEISDRVHDVRLGSKKRSNLRRDIMLL